MDNLGGSATHFLPTYKAIFYSLATVFGLKAVKSARLSKMNGKAL